MGVSSTDPHDEGNEDLTHHCDRPVFETWGAKSHHGPEIEAVEDDEQW